MLIWNDAKDHQIFFPSFPRRDIDGGIILSFSQLLPLFRDYYPKGEIVGGADLKTGKPNKIWFIWNTEESHTNSILSYFPDEECKCSHQVFLPRDWGEKINIISMVTMWKTTQKSPSLSPKLSKRKASHTLLQSIDVYGNMAFCWHTLSRHTSWKKAIIAVNWFVFVPCTIIHHLSRSEKTEINRGGITFTPIFGEIRFAKNVWS